MIHNHNDLRNIIQTNFQYQKILFNIQLNLEVPFIKGFANFHPRLLNSEEALLKWLDSIKLISLIKENQRKEFIEKSLNIELKELDDLKKKKDNYNSLKNFYESQQQIGNIFLKKNNIILNDESYVFLNKELKKNNKLKLFKLENIRNQNLNKVQIGKELKPILDINNQIKACLKMYNIKKKRDKFNENINDKYYAKKKEYMNKINNLNIYKAAKNGIGFERISLEIVKKFANSLGTDYYVGEILANNIWKMRDKKRKGIKQDIDAFIFKLTNNIISVYQIYEFKSSYLAILDDVDKLNNLLNYLLTHSFKIYFKKCNDNIYRPIRSNDTHNKIILNNTSFCKIRFNIDNRYSRIKYLFRLYHNVNKIQFNYITLSQYNKIKNIKNISEIKELLKFFFNNNLKQFDVIRKISFNQGLIGILIKS